MYASHQTVLTKAIVLMLIAMLATPLVSVANSTDSRPLNTQVFQLAQQCLNSENLSVEQLQHTITSIDTLNSTVLQSDHPQKKLFIIRLKKSRNMCLYLAQLQQQKDK